ncbi:hypothetical protein [Actinophytocola sp.]|uniref:hypothetical protein n=1 Tax=Actinophytocola sp. TaxID=1872138 RepID=UPI002D809482|nr:hypothetical protein [Actinophytocola sp.]HET9139990.1 hypothetical protein [Actinophytocola sp.]
MPLLEIATGVAAEVTVAGSRALLLKLLGVQDEQLKRLAGIEDGVRRLREGPWRQARVLIADAAEAGDDDPQRRVYLDEARAALFLAYGNHPEVDPVRAHIAAELGMVLGLLGRADDCRRWAARAHEEAVAVVARAVPRVQAEVNRREWLPFVEDVRDFLWDISDTRGARDFWYPVRGDRTDEFTTVQERYYALGELPRPEPETPMRVPENELAWRLGLDPEAGRWLALSFARQTNTVPGRRLIWLRRQADQVEEYRQVCLVLRPGAVLPRHRLALDLRRRYHAKISWTETG